MITIRPFAGYRPLAEFVKLIACRPYDVMNRAEAKQESEGNSYSFLHIIRSEIDLADEVDDHDASVYALAKKNFDSMVEKGFFFRDEKPKLYVYELEMNGECQTGIVGCSSIDDYFNDRIRKHELTRPVKELDRINHMKITGMHAEPVFLAYRDIAEISELITRITSSKQPVYDFEATDAVKHRFWVLDDEKHINTIADAFKQKVTCTYIADGHHRAASSAKVGLEMAKENPSHTGQEEYNFFLSVIFPASQLKIFDYNRAVKDLNGYTTAKFLQKVSANFDVSPIDSSRAKPVSQHHFGMYLEGKWHLLKAKRGTWKADELDSLDVNILQENLLSPILGIKDPRTDERIEFIGGIRGMAELERRVDTGDMKVAFALYPVTMEQLMSISDAGNIMPPKSTWFEPKLRSGLVVHAF